MTVAFMRAYLLFSVAISKELRLENPCRLKSSYNAPKIQTRRKEITVRDLLPHTDRERGREAEREKRQTGRQREREADRERGRERQTDRERGRQTGRHRERERQTVLCVCVCV